MYKLTRLAILVAAASLPTAAIAQPYSSERTARVSYSDLNLRSPAGRARLEYRVAAVVRDLCGPSWQTLEDWLERGRCMRAAMADARPQIDRVLAGAAGAQIALMTR